MSAIRAVKNAIGAFLGFGNCASCGATFWWERIESIDITEERGFIFCGRCHDTKPLSELRQITLRVWRNRRRVTPSARVEVWTDVKC